MQFQQRHTLLLLTRGDARISLIVHIRPQLRMTANPIWTMTPEKRRDWAWDWQKDKIQLSSQVYRVKKVIFSKQKINMKSTTDQKIKGRKWEDYIWEVLTYMGIMEL